MIKEHAPQTSLAPLGRLLAKDPDDKKFLLKKQRKIDVPNSRIWFSNDHLDQGNTSECVGHGTRSYLNAGPVRNLTGPDQHELYHMAQDFDEWEGNDYEGTSVRGAFKALKKLGFVNEYRWAFDADTVVQHVLTVGPVVMGTSWYTDMFTPDRWGYLDVKGSIAGGHCWLILGVDRFKRRPGTNVVGAARCLNSWGPGWGQKSRFWLTLQDLDRLIQEDGEACVAPELKLAV